MAKSKKGKNKDASLKKMVADILINCDLKEAVIDREVQVSFSGDTTDVEFDVVWAFKYNGKKALVIFECEDTENARELKKEYEARESIIKKLKDGTTSFAVVTSKDNQIKTAAFKDVEEIAVCYTYGGRFSAKSLETCQQEARKRSFTVWGYSALKYYKKISLILKSWTRFELFKELGLNFENKETISLEAIQLKQKGQRGMYLAKIHPGQLLKLAYVVRRTSGRSHAYQRMLNRQRIEEIANFISSNESHTLLPNTLIIVFDNEKKIQRQIKFEDGRLAVPLEYCSAWIIDGQHRAYGFIGTRYEQYDEARESFDLPVVVFKSLDEIVQTQTFIDINYNQKKIKPDLLCDLATVTKDLKNQLTWVSLIGIRLNKDADSPLRDKVKVSEFDAGPISLSSLVKYALLETLLGYKGRAKAYTGRLFNFSPFNVNESFSSSVNQTSFNSQVGLLKRFLVGVQKNTENITNEQKDPWRNLKKYSLLKPMGINGLLLVLAKILEKYPNPTLDFNDFLKPLEKVDFTKKKMATMGTGWQGFLQFGNTMIKELNKGKPTKDRLTLYGKKGKT